MKVKDCKGKLIVVDMYGCKANVINDIEGVKNALSEGCAQFGMDMSEVVCNEYPDNNEYSVVVVCKRGHVTVHVYKDLGFVAADVFSCHEGAHPEQLSRQLRAYFDTDKAKITLLDRGDFGTEVDMKPRKNSNIKLGRRTRNLGNRLKKMILKPRSI